jgi:aminopeptidase N
MAFDADAFNRWEAGQRLATRILLAGIANGGQGDDWISPAFLDACARVLADGLAGDPALAAEALALPSETVLADSVAAAGGVIDPDAIFNARFALRRALAAHCRAQFEAAWAALAPTEPYAAEPYEAGGAQLGRRALKNTCLAYLAEAAPTEMAPRLAALIAAGGNMTDVFAALATLVQLDLPERAAALAAFYDTWRDEALVVDKWLSVQATARTTDARAIRALMAHPAFDLKNPNRVYALIRGFCGANPRAFHAAAGAGYALAADVISELQAINPQVASRIARSFDRWRQFDTSRQTHARAALERIAAVEGLAKDVAEVVGNALKG